MNNTTRYSSFDAICIRACILTFTVLKKLGWVFALIALINVVHGLCTHSLGRQSFQMLYQGNRGGAGILSILNVVLVIAFFLFLFYLGIGITFVLIDVWNDKQTSFLKVMLEKVTLRLLWCLLGILFCTFGPLFLSAFMTVILEGAAGRIGRLLVFLIGMCFIFASFVYAMNRSLSFYFCLIQNTGVTESLRRSAAVVTNTPYFSKNSLFLRILVVGVVNLLIIVALFRLFPVLRYHPSGTNIFIRTFLTYMLSSFAGFCIIGLYYAYAHDNAHIWENDPRLASAEQMNNFSCEELSSPEDGVVDDSSDWVCSSCGESLEVQFDNCWKCGKARS